MEKQILKFPFTVWEHKTAFNVIPRPTSAFKVILEHEKTIVMESNYCPNNTLDNFFTLISEKTVLTYAQQEADLKELIAKSEKIVENFEIGSKENAGTCIVFTNVSIAYDVARHNKLASLDLLEPYGSNTGYDVYMRLSDVESVEGKKMRIIFAFRNEHHPEFTGC